MCFLIYYIFKGTELIVTLYHMALDSEDTNNYAFLIYILGGICQPYIKYEIVIFNGSNVLFNYS